MTVSEPLTAEGDVVSPLLFRAAALPHPGAGWIEVTTQADLAAGLRVYRADD